MKSVGEVMAIGRNFKESLQKALRGLETGLDGFNRVVALEGVHARRNHRGAVASRRPTAFSRSRRPSAKASRVEEVQAITHYDPWFLRHIEEIIYEEADDRPARAAQRCRRAAPAQGDGLFRQAPGHAGGAFGRGGGRPGRDPGAPLGPAARCAARHGRRDERGRSAQAAPEAGRAAGLQADRQLRRRVRGDHALHVLDLRGAELRRAGERGRAVRPREDRHPGRRTQPDRAGHRVRLLLRPCLLRAERGRVRDDHDQLQPGDGQHRLRHVRPALFRAADRRGRAGNPARRAHQAASWWA